MEGREDREGYERQDGGMEEITGSGVGIMNDRSKTDPSQPC